MAQHATPPITLRLSLEEFLLAWAKDNVSAAAMKATPVAPQAPFPFARFQVGMSLAAALKAAGYVK